MLCYIKSYKQLGYVREFNRHIIDLNMFCTRKTLDEGSLKALLLSLRKYRKLLKEFYKDFNIGIITPKRYRRVWGTIYFNDLGLDNVKAHLKGFKELNVKPYIEETRKTLRCHLKGYEYSKKARQEVGQI
jgi:hypothetical protein